MKVAESWNPELKILEKEEGEEFHAQVIRSNELQKCDLVFNELAEVLGALVRAHPNVFLASFDELTPILIELSKVPPSL